MPLLKRELSIKIWMKNIEIILFILWLSELVLINIFNDKKIDINKKTDIKSLLIKLILFRISKFKFNIETKKIIELTIKINPPKNQGIFLDYLI